MNKEQITHKTKYPLLMGKTVQENYMSVLKFHRLPFFVKIEYIHDGIIKKQLENFKEVGSLKWCQIADLLMITERSLHLKVNADMFSKKYADKFIALVDFYSQVYNLYGNRRTPNILMSSRMMDADGVMPLDLMPYQAGRTYLLDHVFHFSKVNPNVCL